MKITAAVLDAIGAVGPFADTQPMRIAALDLAPPRDGELLVKIDACGLCHSDLSVVNGDRPRPMPMAIGHEAAATVLQSSPGSSFAPGDRGVLAFLRGHHSVALDHFTRALERQRTAENVGNVLAALLKLGEIEEAEEILAQVRRTLSPSMVSDLSRAIDTDPDLAALRGPEPL